VSKYRKIKELVDMDYWNKLSDEHKEWLKKFNSEYYYGFFNNPEFERTKAKNIHKSEAAKKQVRRKVKIQNQDLWIQSTKTGDDKK